MTIEHAKPSYMERIEAHRKRIDDDECRRFATQIIPNYKRQLAAIQARGEYYLNLQRRILADPEAMDAWQTFMISVRFISKPVAGITHKNFEEG